MTYSKTMGIGANTLLTTTLRVAKVEKLNNSRNGNPKFKFIFENGLEMVTPTDVMWAYEIAPHVLIGTPLRVKYRMYSKGLQLEEIVK
jgi:hypothetical protein|tara:strand:- start:470 stop:733 length:264 start_codon:yes stop_codon:yes gene_type:complete